MTTTSTDGEPPRRPGTAMRVVTTTLAVAATLGCAALFQQNRILADEAEQRDADVATLQSQVAALERAQAQQPSPDDLTAVLTTLANDVTDLENRVGSDPYGDFRSVLDRVDQIEATVEDQGGSLEQLRYDLSTLCSNLRWDNPVLLC